MSKKVQVPSSRASLEKKIEAFLVAHPRLPFARTGDCCDSQRALRRKEKHHFLVCCNKFEKGVPADMTALAKLLFDLGMTLGNDLFIAGVPGGRYGVAPIAIFEQGNLSWANYADKRPMLKVVLLDHDRAWRYLAGGSNLYTQSGTDAIALLP